MAQLQVTVVEGRNLKEKDFFSGNDTYVQIYLDNKNLQQTSKTKLNSNNPKWNESFVFNHLTGQDHLHIHICDKDAIKDDNIGSLDIDLRDLYSKGYINKWFNISSKFGSTSDGQIHLILYYEQLKV